MVFVAIPKLAPGTLFYCGLISQSAPNNAEIENIYPLETRQKASQPVKISVSSNGLFRAFFGIATLTLTLQYQGNGKTKIPFGLKRVVRTGSNSLR